MTIEALQRPTFYEGQILGPNDLSRGFEHARDQNARHERYLHTWGVAEGLTGVQQNQEWFLTPGFAIDSAGAEIVVAERMFLDVEQLSFDVLPSENDSGSLFPVYVVRMEEAADADWGLQQCSSSQSSRINEGAAIRFGRFVQGWDDQPSLDVADELGPRPNQRRLVLVGFVEWEHEPGTKGKIVQFHVRDNHNNGPKYAGVAADEVIARGGELLIRSQPQGTLNAPGVTIGDHRTGDDKKALRIGLDDDKGNLNEILTVDPKGNVYLKGNLKAEGTIDGRLRKGDVSIESGVAGDGMTLPLPSGITFKQIEDGDVVLHTSVTPRLDRAVDQSITIEYAPLVMECELDDTLKVRCLLKWFKLFDETSVIDVAGTVNYTIIAYVNSASEEDS